MAGADQRIAEARARRDAARAALDGRIALFKPATLRGRALEMARSQTVDALETGLDIARESKGVIAGVIAALGLWFMRRPLLAWLDGLLGADSDQGEEHD